MSIPPRTGYLESDVPLAFAHRGFSPRGTAIENSLSAFQAATEQGFSYLETDLRTSADGVLMVFHDLKLDRATNGKGKLSRRSAAELSNLLIGGSEAIPSFEEMVLTFPEARINFDIKDAASVEPLIEVIEKHSLHHRICVASFADRRRRAVLRRLSQATTSSGGMASIAAFVLLSGWLPRGLMRGVLHDVDCLQLPVSWGIFRLITEKSVQRAHALGLKMHAWTINDKQQMHALFDLGVDGVMTDRADLLAEVMRERGYW
ncbi:glycerophosphodiester phosphodiesterase family protein [Psychromicrobium sp. YIM B11713]|uniref:glycerophosphodiester phosphodiesterase family protein n=1 Tax=Psychromicrobium sp. YIM B11713 TaxID=3145233 RepID=UPI00374F4AE9